MHSEKLWKGKAYHKANYQKYFKHIVPNSRRLFFDEEAWFRPDAHAHA